MIKLAIVGSQYFSNRQFCIDTIDEYLLRKKVASDKLIIFTRGDSGVGEYAKDWALLNRIPYKEFLPKYSISKNLAPLARDRLLAKECDVMIGFFKYRYNGQLTIGRMARKAGKKVYEVWKD